MKRGKGVTSEKYKGKKGKIKRQTRERIRYPLLVPGGEALLEKGQQYDLEDSQSYTGRLYCWGQRKEEGHEKQLLVGEVFVGGEENEILQRIGGENLRRQGRNEESLGKKA